MGDDAPLLLGEVQAILQEAFANLQEAFAKVASLHGRLDRVSADTAFSIGEALGTLGRAKALVGRDIDVAESG